MHVFDVTFFALPAACPCPGVKKKQNKKHISKMPSQPPPHRLSHLKAKVSIQILFHNR
jgi:hypothetical protein